ncbi:hypothetical protein B0O99DRAFT_590172 [Bisporella sp. PMI_857]|nr:hypothetical protein B0O99DRAFT_590711 [Bisporella sp. PMI_857]KAH8600508.1 hypothetical protein B0O99DRAFT_590172 [Bisporella sp. PMI_857]
MHSVTKEQHRNIAYETSDVTDNLKGVMCRAQCFTAYESHSPSSLYVDADLQTPVGRPTEIQWRALNDSIDKNLIRLRPVGYVCHEPTFDQKACDAVLELSRDSQWRASQPDRSLAKAFWIAALQDWVWESGSSENETCLVKLSTRNTPCNQGRLPLYSAVVKSIEHIQKAVIFAQKYNLRLVIKNTGHDGSGEI